MLGSWDMVDPESCERDSECETLAARMCVGKRTPERWGFDMKRCGLEQCHPPGCLPFLFEATARQAGPLQPRRAARAPHFPLVFCSMPFPDRIRLLASGPSSPVGCRRTLGSPSANLAPRAKDSAGWHCTETVQAQPPVAAGFGPCIKACCRFGCISLCRGIPLLASAALPARNPTGFAGFCAQGPGMGGAWPPRG